MALNFFNKIFRDRLWDDIIDDSANPWPGLSPYADPKDSKHAKQFCGRDSESYDVTQLIKNNIFVTLYGKSGNGKTSLLNAGVSPKLREARFVPISIRLGLANENVSFQQHIISEIEKPELDLRIKEINVVDKIEDNTTVDYLWSYFARHKFYNADNKIVFPVIILDQFEEVFRVRQEDTATLLKQISFLMDEGHALTDRTIDGNKYEYSFNFRFVVSIREDDLYKLEDTIDNNYLGAMKQNRYRLRPITKDGAKDIITIPGKDIFDEADSENIVKKLVDFATDDDNFISANMLSLFCSQIYREKIRNGIKDTLTSDFVEDHVTYQSLEQFYLEATKYLTPKGKKYLEDKLVDVAGHRSSISKADFYNEIKNGEKLLVGANKILQESNERIELIHDLFCPIIIHQQSIRKRTITTIKEYLWLIIISILSCLSLYLADGYATTSNFDEIGDVYHDILGLNTHIFIGNIPYINISPLNVPLELIKSFFLFTITIGLVHKSLKKIHVLFGLLCIILSCFINNSGSLFWINVILCIYTIYGLVDGSKTNGKQEQFTIEDYMRLMPFNLFACIVLIFYMFLPKIGITVLFDSLFVPITTTFFFASIICNYIRMAEITRTFLFLWSTVFLLLTVIIQAGSESDTGSTILCAILLAGAFGAMFYGLIALGLKLNKIITYFVGCLCSVIATYYFVFEYKYWSMFFETTFIIALTYWLDGEYTKTRIRNYLIEEGDGKLSEENINDYVQ